jgi:hypothetical protein
LLQFVHDRLAHHKSFSSRSNHGARMSRRSNELRTMGPCFAALKSI